ncbi:phosphatidylglycerol lysyltransferase domain-containing protein [Actinacidiphila alni]|uniref:phosphatidylglycerol lysyltransferase domain-containing protein n=1 Tax=Actinacidiphila alni TaxID=380248 RepID=UPI000D1AD8B9|nr:phosphatidylglycerol lysyltransferase domain-containing protein [Actinacidiphila alni]
MVDWLADAYRTRISDTGREPLFLLLVGLIGSFLFIRFSTRMIRRGVKWWPGNVQPGGLHIHHVVFGQAMMLIGGIGSFAVRGGPLAHDVLAVIFGIGCGLVLDEFALVLHLKDVYWSEQGRQSVDAVILAVSVIGLLLIGQAPLGGYVGGESYRQYVVAGVLLGFVVVCLAKGKVWTGLLGVMVPLLAVVGALRLARPGSPWARWRYTARPRRMARAERREDRIHRRVVVWKTKVMDAVAGAPLPSPGGPRTAAPRPTIVELPPSRIETLLEDVLRPLRQPGAAFTVWYLRVVSAVNAVTGVIAPFRNRVRAASDGEYFTAFLVSPGFTGAVLALVLSVSLRRRKRAAWVVTTLLTSGYALLCAAGVALLPDTRGHPFNWVSLALTALVLVALLVSRTVFNVRGERGNVALGLSVFVVGGALAIGLGTLLVHATDELPPRQWGASLRYTLLRVLTVSGLFDLPEISVPGWTDLAINVLSVALMLVVLLAFFRSPRGRDRLLPADERRLRALLRVYGRRDSLGYFALRRDKAVVWTPERDAAVLYRVVNGVALASGDPVGDRTAWARAVGHWLATARRHAWVPAVTNAGPAAAVVYEAAGFRALPAGDEAVVEVAGFRAAFAEGALALAGLRQAHAVVGGAGYSAVLRRYREISPEEMRRLARLADAWRRHPAERGFSVALGRLGDAADGGCLLAECRDPRGRTCAVVTFVPWGADGLTLDVLRYDRESGRSPVDFLVTEVLLRAAAVSRVSLNFTAFRGALSSRLRRAPLRLLARLGHVAARERAYSAYAPRWQARYLLYERRTDLPRVAAANAIAEGFLTPPRLRRRPALAPDQGPPTEDGA